eukprot:10081511-Alexandrium_andersonii.AAC.1
MGSAWTSAVARPARLRFLASPWPLGTRGWRPSLRPVARWASRASHPMLPPASPAPPASCTGGQGSSPVVGAVRAVAP